MEPRHLLQKLFNKTATREEILFLLDYIRQNPGEELNDLIRKEWDMIPNQETADVNFEQVYREINRTINNQPTLPKKKSGYLSWAATILLLVSVSIGVYFNLPKQEVPAPIPVQMVEKFNPEGQKSKIFLPDGSIVWLNADSKISFPERFDSVRLVSLEGEAYFEVSPNKSKPFVVKSDRVSTLALGTAFNISAFPDDDQVQVALTHGKVQVTVEEQPENHIISPGNRLIYLKNTQDTRQSPFSITEVTGWKDGKLVFENASRAEVFKRLSRWYGVNFNYSGKSSSGQWNYNGFFENEYLENVLASISLIKEFDFEIDNKEVKIIYKP
jgi:ferric-dicitrate binding protein FerR (iron transport regulator)